MAKKPKKKYADLRAFCGLLKFFAVLCFIGGVAGMVLTGGMSDILPPISFISGILSLFGFFLLSNTLKLLLDVADDVTALKKVNGLEEEQKAA